MHERVWQKFKHDALLTDDQFDLFKQYYAMLSAYSQHINLTTLTTEKEVVYGHFYDSLVLRQFYDLTKVHAIADIGSGAGFPALPLKILFPHLRVLLIEVNQKKQEFLTTLIQRLGMTDVEVCGLDWRTFLRTTQGSIALFLSRAALDDQELCRLFRHTSAYRDACLVYWASALWEPNEKVAQYLRQVHPYKVRFKKRKLAFFWLPTK